MFLNVSLEEGDSLQKANGVRPERHYTLYQHIRRPRDLLDQAVILG